MFEAEHAPPKFREAFTTPNVKQHRAKRLDATAHLPEGEGMSDVDTTKVAPQPQLRAALDKVKRDLEGLGPEDLVAINIDPLGAVVTGRGAYKKILVYHDQIAALPGFNLDYLDQFDTYARAAHYTQTLLVSPDNSSEPLQELVGESATLRDNLLAEVNLLIKRGLLAENAISSLKGTVGFQNIAADVMMLSNLLRGVWPQISGKTMVTEAELDRAEVLSDLVVYDLGQKEQAPATIAEVAISRQKTFTLFMTAYDQLRRAISYLRWNEGDTDEIAPSLYGGRKRKAPTADVTTQPNATPQAPVTPQTATATSTTVTTAPAVSAPATGLPGANPFTN
jgi:hypothetical protein